MNKLAWILALLCIHCADVDDELASSTSELVSALPDLSNGTKRNLAQMWGAENLLFTSAGKLLVTGDKGVFELKPKGDGEVERITLIGEQKSPSCAFGGITEARGTLYVNCYGFDKSYLYAAPLSATPSFRAIATFSDIPVGNGLTSDAQGRLYIADTWGHRIWRVTLGSDPLTVASRSVWRSGQPWDLINGIAHHAGSIYWTNGFQIRRSPVEGTRDEVLVALGVFDDLSVDDAGILVTDPGNGWVSAYSLTGALLSNSKKSFGGPSQVKRALGRAGFEAETLIVTERSGNRVSAYEP